MHESYRFQEATPVSVTVSRTAGRWYVSIVADVPATAAPAPAAVIGVDVGVNEYVISDGRRYPVPRAYRASEKQLRRAQQALARKEKGSNNRAKARKKVARLHTRIGNIRRDWLHKTTTAIAGTASVIGIENLNVKGMTGNRHFAKSIHDASFAEFARELTYKTTERCSTVVVADRWFPSSKLCSACGTKTKSLPLNIRARTCTTCNTRHDRDLNAAINLADLAASSAVTACGEFSASALTPLVRA